MVHPRHADMQDDIRATHARAARLSPDQRDCGGRAARAIERRARGGLQFHPRSVAAHEAFARRCSNGSPTPTPSARSASTAARRYGRCGRCAAPATRTTCRCSRASQTPELRARRRAAAHAARRTRGRGLSPSAAVAEGAPASFLRSDLDGAASCATSGSPLFPPAAASTSPDSCWCASAPARPRASSS